MDNGVQIVRRDASSLTLVSLRGNTERMISFVTVGAALGVSVLTKRVAL